MMRMIDLKGFSGVLAPALCLLLAQGLSLPQALAQPSHVGGQAAASGAQQEGGEAIQQLHRFIDRVGSASGTFMQRQSGADRQAAAQSGVFSFQRPGKFRWEVRKPYEQLTLADGKRVYQYDPDLMQVTERSMDASVGASPAAILFGSGKFDSAFTASSLPQSDGMSWMRAVPREGDAGFTHIDIGFRDGLPARLLLLDAFGQTTRIDLSDLRANPELAADAFRFDAPEGVDVVKMP